MFKKSLIAVCLLLLLLPASMALDQQFAEVKTWWAKHVTKDFYSSARLTSRQVKYASEVGFNSIFGLAVFNEVDYIGEEELPTTNVIKQIADGLAEIEYEILPQVLDWRTLESVEYFVNKMEEMTQPTLVHCVTAYSATATVLLGLLYKTQQDPNFEPKLYSDGFYHIGRAHGFDYDMDQDLMELVSLITGEPEVDLRTEPTNELIDWRSYWYAKYVSTDWWAAGQINDLHFSAVIDGGYQAIVNARKGLTTYNNPSQEEVTLLNIMDNTGTYTNGGRQSEERLLETRLDPNKPNEYISFTSDKNYEDQHPDEYGDHIGYNEQFEMQAWNGSHGIVVPYFHIPTDDVTAEIFYQYEDMLMEASTHGSVIVHCRSGYRATAWALLAEGYSTCKNSTWALQQASYMGYRFTEDDSEYQALIDVLDSTNPNCMSAVLNNAPYTSTWLSTISCLLVIALLNFGL
uniref:Uncharacterized protein LOC102810311 n=1 Tax=Saccoglossus kowalevskii TaxID=10224 RepID=A0ABM0MCU9_SACKO|nr:PREDICTED: uncharacterized protein LOC102810311 [Saccoglossus kowalevskii]